MEELIYEKETGLMFDHGNAFDLSDQVQYAIDHPQELIRWGKQARSHFEQKYTAECAYEKLLSIYNQVLDRTWSFDLITRNIEIHASIEIDPQ